MAYLDDHNREMACGHTITSTPHAEVLKRSSAKPSPNRRITL